MWVKLLYAVKYINMSSLNIIEFGLMYIIYRPCWAGSNNSMQTKCLYGRFKLEKSYFEFKLYPKIIFKCILFLSHL